MAPLSWQPAEVIEVEAGRVRLRFSRPDTCRRCAAGEGCGAGVFGRLFPRRSVEIELPCRVEVAVGDWVRVGIPSRTLAMVALLTYGLPLAGFIGGAAIVHGWFESALARDLAALAVGLLLAGVAWRLGRVLVERISLPGIEPLSCVPGATRSSEVQ
jgi:sigma-E factor negative regulatory protein RseC